jgi:type II secretory pathway component PulJ
MKRLVVFGLVVGAVLAAVILAKKSQSSESSQEREARQAEKRRAMFQKMQAGMEAMPDDFPPVMMFKNVEATRENSERILELLEEDRSNTKEPVASAV